MNEQLFEKYVMNSLTAEETRELTRLLREDISVQDQFVA